MSDNEVYAEAMRNSGDLRQEFAELSLSQEKAERVSLWFATTNAYKGVTGENVSEIADKCEEAFGWMNERWSDKEDESSDA